MIDLLYQALNTPLGIVIQTNDPERCRQRLYQARTKAKDPGLAGLSFVPSPADPNQLWIVNREAINSGDYKTTEILSLLPEPIDEPAESDDQSGPGRLPEAE